MKQPKLRKLTWLRTMPIVTAIFLSPLSLLAQQAINPPTETKAQNAPIENPIEPIALETLKKMCDLLKNANSLTFTASTAREQLATTGQMLDFFFTTRVKMVRPSLLKLDIKGDIWTLSLWYNGKTLTLMDPRTMYYAQADAPPSIDETISFLISKVDIPLTLSSILVSDPYAGASDIKTGFEAGVVMVNGVKCHQLAFTQESADWQIWIQDGPQPLPLMLSVKYKTVEGSPKVVISFSDWDLEATIPASEFVFTKPEGTTKIELKKLQ